MRHISLFTILLLALTAGCARQPHPVPESTTKPDRSGEHSVRTMITGLDQYGDENILVINTTGGPYVVGPKVGSKMMTEIHTRLTEAHDRVITIRYTDMPATSTTLAHRCVTGLVIKDWIYPPTD